MRQTRDGVTLDLYTEGTRATAAEWDIHEAVHGYTSASDVLRALAAKLEKAAVDAREDAARWAAESAKAAADAAKMETDAATGQAWAYAGEWDMGAIDERPAVALRRLADDLRVEAAKASADAVKMAADAAVALTWADELEVEP